MTKVVYVRRQLERHFLGTLFAAVNAGKDRDVAEIATWCDRKHFSDDFYAELFEAVIRTHSESGPASSSALANAIISSKVRKKFGKDCLQEIHAILSDYHGMWWHLRYYGKQLHEAWRREAASDDALDASKRLRDPGGDIDAEIENLGAFHSKYGPSSEDRAVDNKAVFQELIDRFEDPDRLDPNTVTTGLDDVDNILNGFAPSTFSVVAGRPGGGKSALLGQLAAHLAVENERPVLFFSLEMSNAQLYERWAKWQARSDAPTPRELVSGLSAFRTAPLELFTGARSMGRIEHETRAFARHRPDVAAIFIDYLQLVEPDKTTGNRATDVATVTRRLKLLATDLGKPVICGCQLNRESVKDGPRLSHLRESGSIENDVDNAILLNPESSTAPSTKMEIIVAKARNGPKGIADVVWLKPQYRFESRRFNEFDSWRNK